jgi:type IV pilus assembly protein PilY1
VVDNNNNPVDDPAQGTKVVISLLSESSSGCLIDHIGYIISGTTADGTYLDVMNVQGVSNDRDYFLDTPPGVTPPATQAQWQDGNPLPLTSERTFVPGATSAATLLTDPLWYAAKWGGFNDMNGNNVPDIPSEWESTGSGNPDNYFLVVNPLNLDRQLNNALVDILSKGASYVAPVVSVDEANRTQSGSSLYMAFFKPVHGGYWEGNLKKYGLAYIPRTDCGRSDPEWTVVDSTGAIAGQCDGTFKPTSQSFWSAAADGSNMDQGGAGAMLKAAMPGSDPISVPASGPYWDFRNIYTYKNGAMVRFIQANITNTDLGVINDYTRYRIINFVYGYSYDSVTPTNPNPVEKRSWILGDIVHSQPELIDYVDPTTGTLQARYIAVGANDGMLHVFTDAATTIAGKSYSAGDEIFAFIPQDLLHTLSQFSNPNAHAYMVDGPVNLHLTSTLVSGNFKQTLIFGEGRGGTSYWALDVTDPDPMNWTVKWQVTGGDGGTAGFGDLAYTFSKPIFAQLRVANTGAASDVKEIAVFAGGYDTMEDGFPEPFTDTNNDGIWESPEPFGVALGGTAGYDVMNPGIDNTGRGIYVVDLETGEMLFSTTYGDANPADDITTGTTQKYSKMMYCFPADISLIPFSANEILMYETDVYGQIWRIAYDYFKNDPSVDYSSNSSTRWTVTRIFASNPGSDLASGDYSGFGSASLVSADAGRKAFYSPDVSFGGNDWTVDPVLYFGTGDREHPRYAMVSNRIYFISDTNSFTDETNLVNLTCDELDLNADADHNGTVDADDATAQSALKNLLYSGAATGFYKILDEEGSCSQSNGQSHVGEAILSQPTLFYKNVYFTGYQPTFTDPCSPVGNAYIYALDYAFGTAAFDYNTANDVGMTEVKNISDTYTMISGTSIPSGVTIITRNGTAAGLVSVGGGVAGIGEGGSTSIPEPPGGLTPILWQTN